MADTKIPNTSGILGRPTMYAETAFIDQKLAQRSELYPAYSYDHYRNRSDAVVVILNQSTGPIGVVEGKDVHGYFYTAPVVPMQGGGFKESPVANTSVGVLDKIWVDAPPCKEYTSIGSWRCVLNWLGERTQINLSLRIPGTADHLWICLRIEFDGDNGGLFFQYAIAFKSASLALTDDEDDDWGLLTNNQGEYNGYNGYARPYQDYVVKPVVLAATSSEGTVAAEAHWFGPDTFVDNNHWTGCPLYVVVKQIDN